MIARLLCVCATVLVIRSVTAAETPFARANAEYASGHFREAIDGYEALVREKHWSAALFYDLGNAEYRVGHLGQAILNYERALALEPNHPETQANLRIVRDESRALELTRDWPERYLAMVAVKNYTWAAAGGIWAVLFALCGLYFRPKPGGLWPTLLTIGLLLAASCGSAVWWLETSGKNADLGIVVGKEVQARLATADRADTVLVLPPGSEIQILNTRGEWIYAALPNKLRGWLPAKSAEAVRL